MLVKKVDERGLVLLGAHCRVGCGAEHEHALAGLKRFHLLHPNLGQLFDFECFVHCADYVTGCAPDLPHSTCGEVAPTRLWSKQMTLQS